MATLFISDLHLERARPEIGEQFLDFLRGDAKSADALYILGDLFEYWIGDDDDDAYYASITRSIRDFSDFGVPVYFMHGNRDFLVGADFAAAAGVRILTDPHLLELYGQTVLLSHGDAMCTDDSEYQEFRAMTRDRAWQRTMLEKTLDERRAYARQAREASMARGLTLDREISDVNQSTVEQTMRDYAVRILLHGHTHRPAVHEFELDGEDATRIVLGDWYEQGSVLCWDENGPELREMLRQARPSGTETADRAR